MSARNKHCRTDILGGRQERHSEVLIAPYDCRINKVHSLYDEPGMPVESSRNRLSPRFRLLAALGHATLRACLEAHFECTGGAVRSDHRSQTYAWCCPNLRGRTPTRPFLARQRRSVQPTLIQGYGAANCPRTAYGTQGFDVIWRCHNLLDRRRSYGQPAPGAGAGAVSN